MRVGSLKHSLIKFKEYKNIIWTSECATVHSTRFPQKMRSLRVFFLLASVYAEFESEVKRAIPGACNSLA